MKHFANIHFKIIVIALIVVNVTLVSVLLVYFLVIRENNTDVAQNTTIESNENDVISRTSEVGGSAVAPSENTTLVFATVDEYLALCRGDLDDILANNSELVRYILEGSIPVDYDEGDITYEQATTLIALVQDTFQSVTPPDELQEYHDVVIDFFALMQSFTGAQDQDAYIDSETFGELILNDTSTLTGFVELYVVFNRWQENTSQDILDKMTAAGCILMDA